MKKRLLFMLTMMVLMLAVCFSASAKNCNELGISHIYSKMEVVQPTCTTQGYDVYKCTNTDCESFYHANYVEALGHDWAKDPVYENRGSYYVKFQTCKRDKCHTSDYDKDGDSINKYFKIEFYDGQAFDQRDTTVPAKDGSAEIPVNYTVLAEVPAEDAATNTFTGTKVVSLQSDYVKEGDSYTYVGKKPIRTKDMRYGEFRFVGWTLNKNYDLAPSSAIVEGTDDINYKYTVKNVSANAKYYAAWEGVNVTYSIIVYNSDGKQFLIPQNVKHGDAIDYPFSYPDRESETSVDFVFDGWEIGIKTAAGDQYNFYPKAGTHIKYIPLFSGDGIKAHHTTTPREYTIEFCDAYGERQEVCDVAYNADATKIMSSTTRYGNYSDDTYVYEYKGYWETESGHKVYLENFTVPKGSVDKNDPIYLKDVNGEYFKTISGDKNLEIENLHSYYKNEEGYFNKNVLTYVFPVTEKGDYFMNASGNAVCLIVYEKGIQLIDVYGNRVDFYQDDANDFRNIKIKPAYYQRVIDRKITIETSLPDDELVPEDYKNGLIVQITNENGQLLAAGVTKDHKCELVVPKAEMYNITVVSPNEKYYSEKGIVWSVFKTIYDKNENILMDLSVNKDYSEETQLNNCRCICHNSFFRGIWIRVLNLLYRLFGIKYVCCYDMYVTIGDLLVYTP